MTIIVGKSNRFFFCFKIVFIFFVSFRFGLRAASCVDRAYPETAFKTLISTLNLVYHRALLALRVNESSQHETKCSLVFFLFVVVFFIRRMRPLFNYCQC